MAGFPRRVILPGAVLALVVTLSVVAWVLATVPSEAMADVTANCPLRNKWAISVWMGADDADTSAALATCGPDAVAAAFALDPATQTWSRWYAGRPDASNLRTLDHLQGVIALGGGGALATPLRNNPHTVAHPDAVARLHSHLPAAEQVGHLRVERPERYRYRCGSGHLRPGHCHRCPSS